MTWLRGSRRVYTTDAPGHKSASGKFTVTIAEFRPSDGYPDATEFVKDGRNMGPVAFFWIFGPFRS